MEGYTWGTCCDYRMGRVNEGNDHQEEMMGRKMDEQTEDTLLALDSLK